MRNRNWVKLFTIYNVDFSLEWGTRVDERIQIVPLWIQNKEYSWNIMFGIYRWYIELVIT